MRQKLALIIALAGFAALTALGVGMAGADPSTGLDAGRAVNGLTTTPALSQSQEPACANELDDDGDELVDLEDPDCDSPADTSEEAEAPAPGAAGQPPASPAQPGQPQSGGQAA